MRFPVRELPAATAGMRTPRPVVDVWLEGLEATGLGCPLDTGATATRFDAELAELAGIPVEDDQMTETALGGRESERRRLA